MANRAAQNRPFKFGAKDRREYIVQDSEVEIRAQNDANGNLIYLGRAKAGSSESDSVWQISFHTWDANGAFLSRTWAENDEGNPSSEYEFSWIARATFTYS
jgi:hypothetical protein